jgi:hypothetical protein
MRQSSAPTTGKLNPADVVATATKASRSSSAKSNLHSLAAIWARKYVTSVTAYDAEQIRKAEQVTDISSLKGRQHTAEKLGKYLKLASAKAWMMTEGFLSDEIHRHQIAQQLVDPWQIAADSHRLFEKALTAYGSCLSARRVSVVVGPDCGRMRQQYTMSDARAIGFVSMQFHYTGQLLLDHLSTPEQTLFAPYIKVMDDHLYMPLRDAYEAAAKLSIESPEIKAVQHLLPFSTKIARQVCQHVIRLHPGYESHSGRLNSNVVRTASVRDVEMFQVFLCLCVLEGNLRSVQSQLFPLCVMLYPHLRVGWQLVREMMQFIGWEMYDLLPPEDMAVFMPYLRTLTEMFADDVFSMA